MDQTERPHIILIMTDQQRTDTIGAWGCDYMTTPAMDRLAAEGLSFRRAYCPGATCVASRAAIFTGMYPHNTGVYSFDPWAEHRNWVQDLSEAGYHCVNMGKMHFTPTRVDGGFHERVIVENPTNGFLKNGQADDDWGRFLTHHGQQRPYDRHLTDPEWRQKYQGVVWDLEERFHSDVFIGDAALSWIRNWQGDKPLFLQIGFTGPHEPWDPLPRHLALYQDRQVPTPVLREGELEENPPQHEAHKRRLRDALAHHESGIDMYSPNAEDIARMRRHYYAKTTTVDEKLGEVLDALEERGLLENSLLVFCSDHGELLGDHGLAYKWLMYEQIVQIPLIVRDSRRPELGGREVADLVSLMDLGPTVLEAAGVAVPSYFEGRSLGPYLAGPAGDFAPREYVYCEDNFSLMMRGERYKLVYYLGQEQGELYDLERDPDELWNLWDKEPALRDKLKMRLLEWQAASTYYNAGYKRDRNKQYGMSWPTAESPSLQAKLASRSVEL
ncbi:MAG: sulfatase-like hydrolase/transferase [Gemmatimonadetes bacterium]|nr:sulfatase-like hydrolase/transferase [Gemmatimonadota bacterium]